MASSKETVSFDDIIQAGREKQRLADQLLGQGRRDKQKLADDILGQGRRANSGISGPRKSMPGSSLASRAGVTKISQRSISNSPKPKLDFESTLGYDLHGPNKSRAPRVTRLPKDNTVAQQVKNDLLYDAATNRPPKNGALSKGSGEEISIRGTAGPYVVIGSNFAQGTTAADIESAMLPTGGEMQSCRILTSTPTVIAEMVFAEKHNAESVISTFNNKKADGRLLHVYMKTGGSTPAITSSAVGQTPVEAQAPAADIVRKEPSYDTQREQSDRNRRRAEPQVQDGTYGFAAKEDRMDVDTDAAREEPRAPPRDVPREAPPRYDRHDDGRSAHFDPRKDMGRHRSYYDRDRGGERPRNDYRLHNDDMYPRPRGRGFR